MPKVPPMVPLPTRTPLAAVVIALLTVTPHVPGTAAVSAPLVPTSALSHINTVAIANGDWPAYVATATGLYRAASHSFTLWQKQSDLGDISALAPNPHNPDDLLFTRWAEAPANEDNGTYRSTDGGRSAQRVSTCPYGLVRTVAQPTLIYGGSSIVDDGVCSTPSPTIGYSSRDYVVRSPDDGVSWTQVYTSGNGYDRSGGIGPLAVSPDNPAQVLAGVTWARGDGELVGSDDGGTTWTRRNYIPLDLISPSAIAFDPTNANTVWSAWWTGGLWRSADGGQTWHMAPLDGLETTRQYGTSVDISATVLAHAQVDALSADPLSGRIYARVELLGEGNPPRGTIFAISPQGHADRFARSLDSIIPPSNANEQFPSFTVTRGGEMVTWCGQMCTSAPPLSIRPLIGTGNWEISSVFSAATAAWTRRTLGQPLSPTTLYRGQSAQYFDKGAIATDGRGITAVSLVPPLLAAHLARPVGGNASTVTYQTLSLRHAQRTPPPPGFHGGTRAVPGGIFVPYSPGLTVAPGYVVPRYFWTYLTDARFAPDGWQRDIGLPLTPAVTATVRKGTVAIRHIMVQAFENAILTYDPRNATPFQVERANIGADYAAIFPQAVR